MRFEISHVLDAIERHLTTEVALAQAVLDVGEIAWYQELDGGRPVNLLRTGQAVDALARLLGEDAVMVYAVAGRPLLTDADLTSKERMVLGRWANDGLIEVVPTVGDRVPEIADITGLPVVTRSGFPGLERRYPWLRGQPDRVLQLVPAEGGARLLGTVPGPAQPASPGSALLSRVWRCPRRDCPTFGERRALAQAVPRMRAGVPICPRHEEPLTNAGGKPPTLTLVISIGGAVRDRFVVRMGRPVVVGRNPDDPDGIRIGEYLTGDAAAMVSRNHVRLELREDALYAIDLSTNGTVVLARTGPYAAAEMIHLTGAPPYPLNPWDSVELYDGVTISRADRQVGRSSGPSSVMGDAPTITMRPQY
jgi:hypothetical protein